MALLCYRYCCTATVRTLFLRIRRKSIRRAVQCMMFKCRFGPAIALIEHLRKRPET